MASKALTLEQLQADVTNMAIVLCRNDKMVEEKLSRYKTISIIATSTCVCDEPQITAAQVASTVMSDIIKSRGPIVAEDDSATFLFGLAYDLLNNNDYYDTFVLESLDRGVTEISGFVVVV